MELTFLKSPRQGTFLQHDGYLFKVNKRTAMRSYWRCSTSHCKASVTLDNKEKNIMSTNANHCHAANPAEIAKTKFYADVRRNILDEPYSTAPEIYRRTLSNLSSSEFLSKMPPFNSIRNFMYNARSSVRQSLPKTVEKLKLDSIRRTVSGGKNFKKTDVGFGEKRLLEETDYLLPNKNPEQEGSAVDYHTNQLMEENHCQDVQASNTNLILEIQKRTQYLPGKQKFTSSDNSPEHIECSVDFHPSQFSVDVEENQCRDDQIIGANKNLETQKKQFALDEKFIKSESSHECSVVYQTNQLVGQNNEGNNCQVVQVIDEQMNVSKKRKLNSREEQIEEPFSVSLPDTMRKDEYHVFGDYVASELRKLSPRALALAKHNINNILFEANIGNYDSPSTSSS